MAVIQYTALIAQIRGSLGGSTLSKSKNGFTISKKPAPRQLKSMAQRAVINGFATNAISWNSLSGTDRTNWATLASASPQYNRIGDLVNMTGYNFYILVSQLLQPTGPGPALITDGNSTSPYTVSAELLTLEFQDIVGTNYINDLELTVTTLSTCVNNCTAVVYLSQPIINQTSQLSGDWYRIGSFSMSSGQTIGSTQTENFLNFEVPAGLLIAENGFYSIQVRLVNDVTRNISPLALAPVINPIIIPAIEMPVFITLAGFNNGSFQLDNELFESTFLYFWCFNQPLVKSDFEIFTTFGGASKAFAPFPPYLDIPFPTQSYSTFGSDGRTGFQTFAVGAGTFNQALDDQNLKVSFPNADRLLAVSFQLRYKPTNVFGPKLWAYGDIFGL